MAAVNANRKRRSPFSYWDIVFQATHGLLLTLLVFSSVFRTAAMQAYPTFQIPDSDSQFQTHFLDSSTDSIYIGALNNIYKLSNELSLENSILTGPVQDNQLCRPAPFNCEHERTTTDHHSKVILVHQNRLVTCGNIYQGTCDIRDPDSLNVTYGESICEVVPNTLSGLAVAFVADAEGDQVLYVASSFGRWLRGSELPTVSTRLIDNTVEENKLFKVSSDNAEVIIPPGTINNSPEERSFNISYIYGFSSGQFSYFVASQPSDHTALSKLTSKLFRLCQGDPDFVSYIELPLVCATDSDTEYNLVQSAHLANLSLGGNETKEVLVAAFSKSEAEISDIPSSESAVCIFPVEDINLAFYNRRINCAQQGTDNTEINWLGSAPCRISQPLVDAIRSAGPDGYCHIVDTMNPLGGDNRDITISSSPVYESSSHITAVAAVQHFETSIIFVGDSDGRLRKLRVDDAVIAVEYEDRDLHQTPVIRNGLFLSQDKEFVFAISEDQITKVPVEECHEYTTCEECHAAQDPYCGWCSLQAECTRRVDAECTESEDGTSPRWLSTDEDCLAIVSVTPEFAPAETTTELTVEITSLPPIPDASSLRCVFVEGTTELGTRSAVVTSDMSKVECNTPGDITATSQGFRMVELQIHYEVNGESVNIADTEFDFYDCTRLSSCSLCAGNKYDCHWCLYSNQCKDSTQDCNNTDVDSADDCPRIIQSEEILIPAGQQQMIEIDGENFPKDTFSYTCQIDFGDQDQLTIQADVIQSRIVCDNALFNYSSSEESRSGTLQVYWGDFALDMEDNLTVTLYKCDQKAVTMVDGFSKQTCGKCLTIDARFQCGWCPDINSCLSPVNEGTCPQNQLLSPEMSCPNPTVVSVSPRSGHIEGGTRLAIGGYNLGLIAGDVKTITVAGADCSSMEFESSQKLYCTTTSVPSPTNGRVIVQFTDSQIPSATSDDIFSYVKPTILSVFPTKGPKSGGTRLVVRGKDLDAGTVRKVDINANPCTSQAGYPCEIIEGNSTEEIICRTSRGNITSGRISVTFDLGCETGGDPFDYREDPVVDSFDKVTSIVSGGLDLTISGDFFDIIQEASMVFRIAGETFNMKCSNRSSKMKLYCKSPDITPLQPSLPFLLPVENISLYMDGVTTYMNLGSSFPGTREEVFTFYNDPVYNPLPSGEDILKIPYEEREREIAVQGKNLTLASAVVDVTMKIGPFQCTVFKLTNTEVTCRPNPNIDPAVYPVMIQHGNLPFRVGQVEYLSQGFPWQLVAGIGAAGVFSFLICSIFVLLCYCCRNVRDNEKYFKELEEQRDAMEMVVAQECKEAFAELQTGVLSITKDVEGTGIPMWDYRSYAMWALFPSQPNHAVLRELTIPPAQRESVRKGLNRFGMLLANKSFLVHFVEVLEKQNTLGVEDLSNIASLLMVTCQGRMDYATAVMKTLLAKAIKEHVREGQEGVLMRRGVHIVEKIVSHWLALLMYPFLEEVAGDPLFSLFYAIHRQIFSGPVDEVTSLARYGLNEAALIRQKVEHKFLTLYVKGIDNNMDDIKVQVLDCDTISQVKDKILEEIYKTSPYSNRPHRGEVDLEWSDSPNGRVLLMDYHGIKTDEGWRRLNTLRSYGVKNEASVALLQTQNGNTSLSSSSSSPSRSINVYANLSPTSSMTPIITHEKEPAAQFMHLVKQTQVGTSKKFDGKKVIAEIYLTRLLTTKGIIQPFVDDLLNTILTLEEDGTNLPLAIKYLFDFLDEQALENNIKDPDVVHQWKSNCLQLRFWVNLIKNPNFVYDISKTPAVDNCLSVIGQCLMDSCSISQHTLTKDSPSSRLLYAKEIPRYRELVAEYYKGISNVPVVSDQDMNTMLADFSSQHQTEFYTLTALNELYFCYAVKCKNELKTSLQSDESCQKYKLVEKLEEVEKLLSS